MTLRLALAPAAAASLLALATAAQADPCTAIPERGPAPSWMRVGATFSGPVPHLIDGDSFCVATADPPSAWVEVRLQDLDAPELHTPEGPAARERLANAVAGRIVSCTMERARRPRGGDAWRSYDRAVATCSIDNVRLTDRLDDSPVDPLRRFGLYTGRSIGVGIALLTMVPIIWWVLLASRPKRKGRPGLPGRR